MKLILAILVLLHGAAQAKPHLRIEEQVSTLGDLPCDSVCDGKYPYGCAKNISDKERYGCNHKGQCHYLAPDEEYPFKGFCTYKDTGSTPVSPPAVKPSTPKAPAPSPPKPPTPNGDSGGAADLGVCYNYGIKNPTLEKQVNNDMARVAACPATSQVQKIRTYFPSYYEYPKATKVPEFQAFAGKKLLPGFNPSDVDSSDKSALDSDLRAVYSDEDVEAIIYLNEKYKGKNLQWAGDFIKSMKGIRTSKPILTSQTLQGNYGEYSSLLAQGFDGIMINIYPSRTFLPFNGEPIDLEEDFNDFCSYLKEITDYYTTHSGAGENFYGVSETGMPADPFGLTVVKTYFDNVKLFMVGKKDCPEFSYAKLVDLNGGVDSWLGIYGFEATSEPNKGSAKENSFGITDAFCPTTLHEEGVDDRSIV